MTKVISCPECDGRGYISRCEFTDNGDGTCSGRSWNEQCSECGGSGSKTVPITNYDLIASMSHEEMADFLMGFCNAVDDCRNGPCPLLDVCGEDPPYNGNWVSWLKSEALKQEAKE